MTTTLAFLQGIVAMGCVIAGLFFFRFWRDSEDRLFAFFGFAFLILAVDYAVLGLLRAATEWRVSVYAFRLGAFCLILYGILEKNRRR